MGKCIKCGRETKSVYDYYTADVISEGTLEEDFGETKYITTMTKYGNFEYFSEYICKRHDVILILISLLFVPIPIGLLFCFEFVNNFLLAVLVSCIAGLSGVFFLFLIISWFLDYGFIRSTVVKRKNKNLKKKKVFGRREYEDLMKQNNVPFF